MCEFNASIFGGELPVGPGVVGIAVVFPSGDFAEHDSPLLSRPHPPQRRPIQI